MKTELEIANERILELEEQVKKLTSNTVLADSTKPDNKTEIIDAYMNEAKKYYPKKNQIRF
jgi:hypothetical protein